MCTKMWVKHMASVSTVRSVFFYFILRETEMATWIFTISLGNLFLSCLGPTWKWVCFLPYSYLVDSGKSMHFLSVNLTSHSKRKNLEFHYNHPILTNTYFQERAVANSWMAEMQALGRGMVICKVGCIFASFHGS